MLLAVAGTLLVAGMAHANPGADAEGVRFFEEKVRPLFDTHCNKCHGDGKVRGGLDLMSRDAALKGGDTGAVVVPGKPGESLLLEAVSFKNDKLQMPPKGKLSQDEIDVLTKWVEMGVPWGKDTGNAANPAAAHGPPPVDEKARQFWSFKQVERPAVPAPKDDAKWVKNPIDAFVLDKLNAKQLAPAGPAEKVALIRRATYDLTGLPPTLAEVESFVKDNSPEAYDRLIDTLLASPRYGEKWGRHWLDLVRFAETNSYERDRPKPSAWRYRDYVIRSFNNDKPYDRFLREQLAGDELPDADKNNDNFIATGFYRLGIWDDEPADREQHRYDVLDDIVATVGQGFLGMTVDCARCHDHKVDPIPQADYYKLLAFFQNITDYKNGGGGDEVPLFQDAKAREEFAANEMERQRQLEAVRDQVKDADMNFLQLLEGEPGRGKVDPTKLTALIAEHGERVLGKERNREYIRLRKRLAELRKDPDGATILAVTENGSKAKDTFVMVRGSAHSPGDKVEPGFLSVLTRTEPTMPPPASGAKTSGRRTILANWIASKDNPLTARVMVNRIWQYHFGRGLVRSTSNFGYQGDAPTHPELLDWLASEFMARGWSIKQMHKLIMTSSAYRMSSQPNDKALAADPKNDLMWRFDMRRLTAEEIRDSILAANGTLNLTMYGPGVFPHIPREVMVGQSRPGEGWGRSSREESARRSVYIHAKRSLRVPIIESFDGAETDKSCPTRFVTVQPTQALGMINGEFLNKEAEKLAERVKKDAGDDVKKQVSLALNLVTSREPTADEVDRGVELYRTLIDKDGAKPKQAMNYVCLVMLNLNEFVYLD